MTNDSATVKPESVEVEEEKGQATADKWKTVMEVLQDKKNTDKLLALMKDLG